MQVFTRARLWRLASYSRTSPNTRTFTSAQYRAQEASAPGSLTVAGGSGYYYLLDEYHTASNLLLSSVEELQKTTAKVRDYTQKIERVESELKALERSAATTEQIKELRAETRKLYDGLNLQQLELKTIVRNI
ncbi:9915_t:CDS:2, partial [Acaulospora morrowiae]